MNDPVAISAPIEDIEVFSWLITPDDDEIITIGNLNNRFIDVDGDSISFSLEYTPSEVLDAYIDDEPEFDWLRLEYGSHILNGDKLAQFIGEVDSVIDPEPSNNVTLVE